MLASPRLARAGRDAGAIGAMSKTARTAPDLALALRPGAGRAGRAGRLRAAQGRAAAGAAAGQRRAAVRRRAAAGAWAWSPQLDCGRLAAAQRAARLAAPTSSQTTDQRLWISLPADDDLRRRPLGDQAAAPAPGSTRSPRRCARCRAPRCRSSASRTPQRRRPALALDRAASARDWMVMRGVPARRIAVSRPGAARPRRRRAAGSTS